MKGSSVLLLLVFVGAGYVLHPMVVGGLRDAGLVAAVPEAKVVPAKEEEKEPSPETKIPTIDVDLSGVTGEDFPDSVTLLSAVKVTLPGVTSQIEIPVGTDVKPVGLEGEVLIFEPNGIDTRGRILVDRTNFKQRIKPILAEKARRATEQEDKVAEVEPEPMPKPEPEPEPAPAPEVAVLDEARAVELMQSSVKSGDVREFTFDQVLGWKLEGEETVDGKKYQVGMVVYTAETLFGPQKLQVKALIRDGEVVKWVWAKTGVEVR